jgi:pSer/pThr/pTyr-binding forkhead associated (FHA) protein
MPVRFRILPAPAASGSTAEGAAGPRVERAVEIAGAPREIRLGRRGDLELPLPFAALSGVHARLERGASGWSVEDAGSTNGTWVAGARLGPGERRPLAAGDELVLANVRVRFEGDGASALAAEGTATIARRLVDDLFASRPARAPTLRVLRGAPARRLVLAEPGRAYLAGRAEDAALCLDVEEISREHATFTPEAAGVVVRDLGSKNGVSFAGARIARERLLGDGDVVTLGPVEVGLDDPVSRYLRDLEAPPPPGPPSPSAEGPSAVEDPGLAVEGASTAPRRATRLAAVVGVLVLLALVGVAAVLVASPR